MKLTPEHLEKIKTAILTIAREIRAAGQECQPMLMAMNSRPDGQLGRTTGMDISALSNDGRAKLHQKLARDPSVAISILIHECWGCFRNPGEPLPIGKVSEQPDREETLMINVLTASEQWLLFARIDGKTVHDADWQKSDGTNFEGRFVREGAKP